MFDSWFDNTQKSLKYECVENGTLFLLLGIASVFGTIIAGEGIFLLFAIPFLALGIYGILSRDTAL